ncbi:MAG: ECF transporter S component [Ignavibacterium sp.]|jgi:energy-coupling factor transport system substrate-specific component
MWTTIRRQFDKEVEGAGLPFVAFCIALNLTSGQLAAGLKIPLYLDSIGTVLAAVLCGPWSAIVAGSLSNILASALGNPAMMFFIPVVAVIGAFSGFLARKGWFRFWYLVVPGGILQGLVAAVVSAPIAAYVFGGVMLSGTDVLVLYFRSVGNTLLESVFYQGISSDPVDKTVTYLIVYILCRNLPLRLLQRFNGGNNVLTPAMLRSIHGS